MAISLRPYNFKTCKVHTKSYSDFNLVEWISAVDSSLKQSTKNKIDTKERRLHRMHKQLTDISQF